MEIHLGTGGYTNEDWVGLLYPAGTPPSRFLEIYSQNFNAVELNSSFYAIPGTRAFEGMLKKSGGRVRFCVKAHRSMTHERDADADMFERLRLSVEPLRGAGMLGPFLFQFPYSFHRTSANRAYLRELVERMEGEPVAIEFRNQGWHLPEVADSFREQGLTWVSVDYPQVGGMPAPELVLTDRVAYVRLHGRNEEKWYGGKNASERHDYRYTPDELRGWVQWVAEREAELDEIYVFFLNTTKGHALANLRMIRELFVEFGLDPATAL